MSEPADLLRSNPLQRATDMRRTRMLEERDDHYLMHDGEAPFRVPKEGLSPKTHEKIRALAVEPEKKARGGAVPAGAPKAAFGMLADGSMGVLPPAKGQPIPVEIAGDELPLMRDDGPKAETIDFGMTQVPPTPAVAMPPSPPAPVVGQYGEAQLHGAPPGPDPKLAQLQGQVEKDSAKELTRRAAGEALAAGVDKGAETAKTAPPVVAAKPAGGGAGLPKPPTPDEAKANDLLEREQLLAEQRGSIEDYKAKAQAEEMKAQGKAMLDLAQQETAIRNRAKVDTDAAMGRVNAARASLANIDSTVDPGRYWASRSTGGKIAGILGLVMGAIGAGPEGINRAAGMLNQAIDRDLEAQKAEHEMRLKKGQMGLEGAQSIYAMTRQATGDELAAHAAAKATALELSINKLKQIEATAQSPLARANAQQAILALEAQKNQHDEQAKQVLFDNNIKRGQLGVQQGELGVKQAAAAGSGALDQKQRDELLGVETYHRDIQRAGENLKSLIKAYGTAELTGPQEKMMRQAVTDMATASAKLNDPSSVARASEVEQEAKNIFEPGFMQTTDAALGAVDSYMKNAAGKRDTHLRVRGIRP